MKPFKIYILFLLIILGCNGNKDTSTPADFELNISEERDIAFLVELVKDNDRNPENFIRLANYYLKLEQPSKALETLRAASENFPHHEKIKLLLARALIEAGQPAEAAKYAAFDDVPENEPLLYYETASQYWFEKGEHARSLNNINLAINIDQGNGAFYAMKAKNLLYLNDTTGAVRNYALALSKEGTLFDTYIEFLHLLIETRDIDAFNKIFKNISSEYQNHSETHFLLANYLASINQYDSAKAHIFLIANQPEIELRKIKSLADINFQQKNYDSSIYYLKDYEVVSPELLYLQARAYDRLWDFEKSEEAYLKIIEIDSTDVIAVDELDKLRRKVRYLQLKRREENRMKIMPSSPISPVN